MRFVETAREIAASFSCVIRMHRLNKNEFKISICKRDEWCRRLSCKGIPSSRLAVATVGPALSWSGN